MLIQERSFRPAVAFALVVAAAILHWLLCVGAGPDGGRPRREPRSMSDPALAASRTPATVPAAREREPLPPRATAEAEMAEIAKLRVLTLEGPPEAELALVPVVPWHQMPGPGRFHTRDGVSLRLREERALRGAQDPEGGWSFERCVPAGTPWRAWTRNGPRRRRRCSIWRQASGASWC